MAQNADVFLPDDLYYDPKDHLWSRVEDDGRVRIGLNQFGQKAAGTVAYINIVPVGRAVKKGRSFGALEAGKFIGPLKVQVSGTIVEVNEEVVANPSLINTDPYGAWLVIVAPTNLEADLADRISGAEAIQAWLDKEYQDYLDKGLFSGPEGA